MYLLHTLLRVERKPKLCCADGICLPDEADTKKILDFMQTTRDGRDCAKKSHMNT
jgi:hypothetical protein